MTVLTWDDFAAGRASPLPSIGTIGVFDGVHRGHRRLFDLMRARAPGLRRVAVTFRDNPKRLTRPEHFHGDICSLSQKLERLASAGIELCVLIDFSQKFSRMSGEDFVQSLIRFGAIRYFVVGWNFAFGHKLGLKAKDLPALAARYQTEAELVEPVFLDDLPISSSRIRSCINEGRMDQALAMLGYPYTLDLGSYHLSNVNGDFLAVPVQPHGLRIATGSYEAMIIGNGTRYPGIVKVEDGNQLSFPGDVSQQPYALEFSALR